jgi:signal transduction histidine kinase
MNLLAAERGITITLDAAPITIAASETAVHRSVIALLDNALHFAPDDSTIEVSARTERGFAEIRVADHGPGITGVAPEQAFERFMRGTGGDASAGGFGIGLSLVRDTVARFGGTAQVESTGPDGTVILLRLPRSRRP